MHVSAGSAVPWCFVEIRSTSSGISFDFHLWNRVSSFDTAYSVWPPTFQGFPCPFILSWRRRSTEIANLPCHGLLGFELRSLHLCDISPDFFIFYIYYIYLFGLWVHICPPMCPRLNVWDQKTTFRVDSLPLPCRFWGLNSNDQVWQHSPLPTEPSCWPILLKFYFWEFHTYIQCILIISIHWTLLKPPHHISFPTSHTLSLFE